MTHLHVHSAFSFGEGPSSVAGLVRRAAELDQSHLALTDTNSVTGIPELVRRCHKAGIAPIGGAEILLEGGSRLTLLADGPTGFSSLCQLLSAAGMRDPERRGLRVRWEELERFSEGLVCLTGAPPEGLLPRLLRQRRDGEAEAHLRRLLQIFGPGDVMVEIVRSLAEREESLSLHLLDLADASGVPAVATNAVRHATKAELPAHEALLRVRLGLPIGKESASLPLNGERYLKSAGAMQSLFRDRPDTLRNADRLAERLAPPLDPETRHYPRYRDLPRGESSFSYLSALVWEGARRRGVTDHARLVHELETIRDLDYADYLLVCREVVEEARRRDIGCALRGSAIGSAALYALGISEHDPIAYRVSFDRFLSRARTSPPDVDVDFAHDRRDEMQTWLRQRFGERQVAGVANYVTYRGRSLLRDLGKVLGADDSQLERLRELLWNSRGDDLARKIETMPELIALGIDPEQYGDLFALCASLAGRPRHLGTHSSGMVLGNVPLCQVAPLVWAAKGVSILALDKDDVEAVGLLKLDQLSLRTLTAIEIARKQLPTGAYEERDREDPQTLEMVRAARTIGAFQLESPAQQCLAMRLQADRFLDLVHAVGLVRPGPLVGGGIAPYLAVRQGRRRPRYPLPELASVLDETFGRILFQDQALGVIQALGGYPPGEADAFLKSLRRAREEQETRALGLALLARARERGVSGKAFEGVWRQVKGFSKFGFCFGHALAFAAHAQGTAWLLRHHPAPFLAALLSVEPCGFWPVSTVVQEANRRGIAASGPCLNRSSATRWEVEHRGEAATLRCSLHAVQEITADVAGHIVAERERNGPYRTLADLARLAFVPRVGMEWLAVSGALEQLEPSRRRALWSLPATHTHNAGRRPTPPGQLAADLPLSPNLPPGLEDFGAEKKEELEWRALGFSPRGHPLRRRRAALEARGVVPCAALQACEDGAEITVAGLSLSPHRPPVPSGEIVVFLTLEDESGMAQVTVPPEVYAVCGAPLITEPALVVRGSARVQGAGCILIARDVLALEDE